MKKISLIIILALFLVSCNSKKRPNGFLSPSNLKSQFFTIDPEKDTILQTSHAAILQISKGTFNGSKPVSIEIKEAFTPDEIFLSGLTTMSDRAPLRSAGMLYFNATVEGDAVKPTTPIDARIPAKDPDPEMQLFKGEIQRDSTVNWTDPQQPDTIKPKDIQHSIEYGRGLFLTKCASCHSIFKDMTGPALRNLQYRGPWKNPKNILRWVNNPSKFMANDKYTQNLKSKYGSLMLLFPDISESDIRDLLAYINNAKFDEKLPVTAIDDTLKVRDCGSDTLYISVKDEFEEYDTASYPEVFPDTTTLPFSPYDPVYRDIYKEGYDFQITENGWYNIDAFLKENSEGIENVELIADLKMTEDTYMNVYLFIPTERVMQVTNSKKGNQYYFDFENGTIPLPLHHRAVILAFGSSKDKIIYGVSEFTIEKKQIVPVEIKETTKEGLKNILFSKNLNGIELDAIKKKMEVHKTPCDDAEPGAESQEFPLKRDTIRGK